MLAMIDVANNNVCSVHLYLYTSTQTLYTVGLCLVFYTCACGLAAAAAQSTLEGPRILSRTLNHLVRIAHPPAGPYRARTGRVRLS